MPACCQRQSFVGTSLSDPPLVWLWVKEACFVEENCLKNSVSYNMKK